MFLTDKRYKVEFRNLITPLAFINLAENFHFMRGSGALTIITPHF